MKEKSSYTRHKTALWAAAKKRAHASLALITPEEDAKITADALSDPDNPPLTDADFAAACGRRPRCCRNRCCADVESGVRRKPPTKTLVSIRLSPDVLEHFRADGDGWQTRIDDALRDVVGEATPAGVRPQPCRSGTVTTRPSSSSLTRIWQDSREVGRTS